MDLLISARRPDPVTVNKKKKEKKKRKRICRIVDFAVPADNRESEKRDKYLDFARGLKENMENKVTVIPIVSGAIGTVTKGLVQGLEDLEISGRVETIQTTVVLRSVRI